MRIALTLLLILALAAGIFTLAHYWEWMVSVRLAGPMIIALLFFAVATFGLYLDLGQGVAEEATSLEICAHFINRLIPILLLVIGFSGGAWVLLLIVEWLSPAWLPGWISGTIFLVSFVWYVAGVIKLLMWLSDRSVTE
jgi:hypothetical protein